MNFTDGVILGFVIIIVTLLIWHLLRFKASGGSCNSCKTQTTRRFKDKQQQSHLIDAYRKTYHKNNL